jgi:hypothetical protein
MRRFSIGKRENPPDCPIWKWMMWSDAVCQCEAIKGRARRGYQYIIRFQFELFSPKTTPPNARSAAEIRGPILLAHPDCQPNSQQQVPRWATGKDLTRRGYFGSDFFRVTYLHHTPKKEPRPERAHFPTPTDVDYAMTNTNRQNKQPKTITSMVNFKNGIHHNEGKCLIQDTRCSQLNSP